MFLTQHQVLYNVIYRLVSWCTAGHLRLLSNCFLHSPYFVACSIYVLQHAVKLYQMFINHAATQKTSQPIFQQQPNKYIHFLTQTFNQHHQLSVQEASIVFMYVILELSSPCIHCDWTSHIDSHPHSTLSLLHEAKSLVYPKMHWTSNMVSSLIPSSYNAVCDKGWEGECSLQARAGYSNQGFIQRGISQHHWDILHPQSPPPRNLKTMML